MGPCAASRMPGVVALHRSGTQVIETLMQRLAADRLARAHYIDAGLYDQRYARRRQDLAFYTKQAKSPCLELGAGTGRVTRALIAAGVKVTAVEREAAMCQRLADTGARVLRGDMTSAAVARLAAQEKFASVIAPFHVFSHVHESKALVAFLARVKTWLRPGGRLVFDVPMPNLYMLALSPARRYRVGFATVHGERYRYLESFDYDPVTQLQTVIAHYDFEKPGHPKSFVVPLLHRHYFPQELRALLREAGLTIKKHSGDFVGGALGADSEEQVVIAV